VEELLTTHLILEDQEDLAAVETEPQILEELQGQDLQIQDLEEAEEPIFLIQTPINKEQRVVQV
jgi:hypothetical protein